MFVYDTGARRLSLGGSVFISGRFEHARGYRCSHARARARARARLAHHQNETRRSLGRKVQAPIG